MRGPTALVALGAVAAVAAGCGAAPAMEAEVPELAIIEAPVGPGSGEPNVTAGTDGFYLSWIEPAANGRHAVRFAHLGGDGWSAPRTVVERGDLFVNWADFPSMLALGDGTLAVHWLERNGPAPYAYDVRIALSRDSGQSWSDDLIPHRDGTETEHGFVSLFPLEGRIGAVWLDGRAMLDDGPMALRFTTVGIDGSLAEEVVLDDRVCECCQTGAALTSDGPVVVYRGLADGNIRDIRIVRRVDGRWTEGRTVHDDGWMIPGCPVNGPAVVADGRRVAVAWFTGAAPRELDAPEPTRQDVRRMAADGRVLVAFSRDGGASFDAPIRVDEGGGMGRVDLLPLDGGRVMVAWLERGADGAEVRARIAAPDGLGPVRAITPTSPERASGFPRMARLGDQVLIAWTDTGDPGTVRTAVASFPGGGQ